MSVDEHPGAMTVQITLNIEDELLDEAERLTGIENNVALVRERLRALIERQSARRLVRLGGSESNLRSVPRRRTTPA